ncbi:MAG: hypothetical protein P1U46_04590 [Patescibacteria group bacterium]|nr:hypothetical protein [Patescibacteria group bacterium]
MSCFFIILHATQSFFRDLLSIITRFFKSTIFAQVFLKSKAFISKSIVSLSSPVLLTIVILL